MEVHKFSTITKPAIFVLILVLPVVVVSFWSKGESTQTGEALWEKPDCNEESFYKAAVVEYQPIPIGTHEPRDVLIENVKNYQELIKAAAEHEADIIVFPEYGITTNAMPSNRGLARDFLVDLPEFGTVPCDEQRNNLNNYEILSRLSCSAKLWNMYVVANLGEIEFCDNSTDKDCPSDGAYHYNTNAVFDRNGTLIARYRKFHLYFEPHFNTPSLELSTFETDFGVEFGIFTCFDIIFANPAVELVAKKNIRNFVFPTAWIDELPFLTAIQAQSLWAQSNRANLLASGYHNPVRGSMGSGIYSGIRDREQALNYTFDPESGTKLIVASVPTNDKCDLPKVDLQAQPLPKVSSSNKISSSSHMWLREDLTNYTNKVLDPKLVEDTVCHLDLLCCHFKYDLIPPRAKGNDPISYSGQLRFLAMEGRRTVAAKTDSFEWQVCAVVHCLDETLESCTELEGSPENYGDFDSDFHPKFKSLTIELKPVKVEYHAELEASQPALSLIDNQFSLIPQNLFNLNTWEDPETKGVWVEAVSNNEELLKDINIKTVGLIQKIYGGRL